MTPVGVMETNGQLFYWEKFHNCGATLPHRLPMGVKTMQCPKCGFDGVRWWEAEEPYGDENGTFWRCPGCKQDSHERDWIGVEADGAMPAIDLSTFDPSVGMWMRLRINGNNPADVTYETLGGKTVGKG